MNIYDTQIRIMLEEIDNTSDDDVKTDLTEQIQMELTDLINRYGRYDENNYIWRVVKRDIVKQFGSYGFEDIYEEVAKQETYNITVSIIAEYVEDEEEYEIVDEFKNYLADFEYDEIDEYRLSLTCIGEFELNNFHELVDEYENRLYDIEIRVEEVKEGEEW